MIKVRAAISGSPIEYSSFKFSGGEIQVKIKDIPDDPIGIIIEAHIHSSDDLMELCLLTDALKRKFPKTELSLICPYLPYARQDRVCYPGEALSLKVLCNIINSLEFSKVTVWDVHSDVSLALINNVEEVRQYTFYPSIVMDLMKLDGEYFSPPILVSPDAGSQKKIYETAKSFNLRVMKADKTRNPENGEITGTSISYLPTDFRGEEDLLIMDDICDGGKTFIELEKVLRPMTKGKIMLYVTHGIFSKTLAPLYSFDRIFVANPWPIVSSMRSSNLVVL